MPPGDTPIKGTAPARSESLVASLCREAERLRARCHQLTQAIPETAHGRLRQRLAWESRVLRQRLGELGILARAWKCQGLVDPLSAQLLEELCRRGLAGI